MYYLEGEGANSEVQNAGLRIQREVVVEHV
jgi:hypothetical protein